MRNFFIGFILAGVAGFGMGFNAPDQCDGYKLDVALYHAAILALNNNDPELADNVINNIKTLAEEVTGMRPGTYKFEYETLDQPTRNAIDKLGADILVLLMKKIDDAMKVRMGNLPEIIEA